MSINAEEKDKNLRQQFASEKPNLISRGSYVTVKSDIERAYFNGEFLKYEGKLLSQGNEAQNVKSPSKLKMYAIEKGGFSLLAEGHAEAVSLNLKKINRMNADISKFSRESSYEA